MRESVGGVVTLVAYDSDAAPRLELRLHRRDMSESAVHRLREWCSVLGGTAPDVRAVLAVVRGGQA